MEQAARYLRHSLIDWFSQADVSAARIGVVGAGAVGNETLKCLALLGVGSIDIYDFDRIEVHNLTRSVLFREGDIGRNKAECAAERVRDLDPNIKVTAFPGDFYEQLDLATLTRYTAIICCVDNFEARIRLNLICRLWGINLINTGIDSRYAVIDVFPFAQDQGGACYECTLPPSVYQRLSQRYSCGGLKRIAFVEKRIPTTVITASLAGSVAASRALRLGSQSGDVAASRVFCDSIAGTSARSELSARADCPVCSTLNPPVQRTRIHGSLHMALTGLADSGGASPLEIILPESLILSFQCKVCGAGEGQAEPLLWRASDHDSRLANCRRCGTEGAVDVEIRDTLSAETLARCGKRLPRVPFVFVPSENGTHVLVIGEEGS